ncbi:MAG TPA: GH92 family glycosyl hydrolase [Terracidiphilus sp.]|jgi:predicted alpha-1,2-mannosidase
MPLAASLRIALVPVVLTAAVLCAAQTASTPYAAVNPVIGTDGGGNTFPGATLPFGMIQWSPDTNTDAWYIYHEKQITGFSLTHVSGAGCPLYGDFAVLPSTAELTSSPGSGIGPYAAAFDHNNEEAHPGYYAVTLGNGVRVEITVAERSGIARFIFPTGTDARLLVNAGSSANTQEPNVAKQAGHEAYGNQIELASADSFAGSVSAGGFCSSNSHYKLYVAGHFNKPYKTSRLWQDDAVLNDEKTAKGKHTGAWLDFGREHEIVLKVGVSFVSQAGAEANLRDEIPAFDFDSVHANARRTWSDLLSRVDAEGGTADQRTIFYTGLYHSLLSPTLFSDRDGNYIGFDDKVHSLDGTKQKAQYANYSDWDIYRNTVQLQALLDAARESDMMQSLVNDAEQSGWYPRWPAANDVTYVMGGDSPVIVLASSYAFGAHDFDIETALKYMVKAGTQPGMGPHNNSERPFLADYLKLGYSPAEKDSIDASRTLEYSSDDFAIAQFAKAIGHTDDSKLFLKQSEDWKNLLDPTTGWIRPRNSDGTWLAGFDPEHSLPKRPDAPVSTDQYGFEEGNTWQYTFMVPFDYPALFAAIGGDAKVTPRLDRFFLKLRCWGEPCYNIENEPDFVVPYAYVFAGQPWKTQEVVTRIAKEVFKTTPEGIPGNDDLGATSGVYVWDALGLYPAVPGVGGLVIGTPMFEKATLHLDGDRTLVISRQGSGIYVQKATLDGAAYTNSWLPIAKLRSGTTQLDFTMGEAPNMQRGAAIADRPPSFR